MKETINEHITANESPVSGNSLKSRLLGGGLWKMLFWVISIIALVTIILLSTQAGISGDELCHREQAGFVCDYYKTMGKDTTALEFRPPDYNLPIMASALTIWLVLYQECFLSKMNMRSVTL